VGSIYSLFGHPNRQNPLICQTTVFNNCFTGAKIRLFFQLTINYLSYFIFFYCFAVAVPNQCFISIKNRHNGMWKRKTENYAAASASSPFSVCFVLLLAGERNLVNLVNLFRLRREWLPRQPVFRFPLSAFRSPLSVFRFPLTSPPVSCTLCRRWWRCGLCRCRR